MGLQGSKAGGKDRNGGDLSRIKALMFRENGRGFRQQIVHIKAPCALGFGKEVPKLCKHSITSKSRARPSLEDRQDGGCLEFPAGSEYGSNTMGKLSWSCSTCLGVSLAKEGGSVGRHGTKGVLAVQ